jgi:hypothetical protein
MSYGTRCDNKKGLVRLCWKSEYNMSITLGINTNIMISLNEVVMKCLVLNAEKENADD